LIGKLIYVSVTRSDIIFVVGVLSRYMQYPYQFYWTAACRIWTVACHILQYLKGAPSKGLYYRPSSYLDIVKYSDTD